MTPLEIIAAVNAGITTVQTAQTLLAQLTEMAQKMLDKTVSKEDQDALAVAIQAAKDKLNSGEKEDWEQVQPDPVG